MIIVRVLQGLWAKHRRNQRLWANVVFPVVFISTVIGAILSRGKYKLSRIAYQCVRPNVTLIRHCQPHKLTQCTNSLYQQCTCNECIRVPQACLGLSSISTHVQHAHGVLLTLIWSTINVVTFVICWTSHPHTWKVSLVSKILCISSRSHTKAYWLMIYQPCSRNIVATIGLQTHAQTLFSTFHTLQQ